jgi:hypothetical protein
MKITAKIMDDIEKPTRNATVCVGNFILLFASESYPGKVCDSAILARWLRAGVGGRPARAR